MATILFGTTKFVHLVYEEIVDKQQNGTSNFYD